MPFGEILPRNPLPSSPSESAGAYLSNEHLESMFTPFLCEQGRQVVRQGRQADSRRSPGGVLAESRRSPPRAGLQPQEHNLGTQPRNTT